MNDASRRLATCAQAALRIIADFVFPPHCTCCGQAGGWICQACFESFERIGNRQCSRCGNPAARGSECRLCDSSEWALDKLRGVALAEGPLLDAIHAFKYRGVSILTRSLADLLDERIAEFDGDSVVVPIPLHPSRERQRGYNQSALLARELIRRSGLELGEAWLVRTRNTRPQVGLGLPDRHANVEAAFAAAAGRVAGSHVLLIDDVCTTGATLNSGARVLRAAGATAVSALVVARPRLPQERNAIDDRV